MKIVIEKNVPLPTDPVLDLVMREPDGPRTMPRKWPWPQMKPNDSFVVPNRKMALSAHNSFLHHAKTKYTRFQPTWYVRMRKQPDGTYRLWLLDREQPST